MQNKPIELALKGIHDIANSDFIALLLNKYSIDDKVLSRIKGCDFRDWIYCDPFFHLKECDELYTPVYTLSKLIINNPDKEIVKLFFLLYCCSSTSSIFRNKILKYFNPHWDIEDTRQLHHLDVRAFSQEDYEALKSGRILERVGIFGIDDTLRKIIPEDSYIYSRVRQGILQICLTAGYHYTTDINIIPDDPELHFVREDLPIILASSQYVSTITGEDFYKVMREIINEFRYSGPINQLINICENKCKTENLKRESEKLQTQLKAIEEEIRKTDTADEIMTESFGWPVPEEEIKAWVSKCNSAESRELLYRLESKLGTKLSFLYRFPTKVNSNHDILSFLTDNHVVFSDEELSATITVENLVDIIKEHRKFLDVFVVSLFYNKEIHWNNTAISDWYDPKYYNLETKLKEVQNMFSIRLNVPVLSTEDDIRKAVVDKYPALREFVGVIRDTLEVPEEAITLSADIFEDLGADSLSIFDLLDKLEDTYGFRFISDEDYNHSTIKDIIWSIVRQIHHQNDNL